MAAVKNKIIHAVLGSDDVEVKRVALGIAAELTPPGDFGVETIDGAADNSEQASQRIYQAIEAMQTFGFFGGEKLVWLKNANFLGDNRVGDAEATLSALEKLADVLEGGLPDGTYFLLSAGAADKRRSFYKRLLKMAAVQVMDRLDNTKSGWEDLAADMVRQGAQDRGMRFAGDAEELFVMFTGGDRRTIEGELEKLDLYLGSRREVQSDDVRLMTPMSKAGVVFELGNALAMRNSRHALELLKQLLFQGEKAFGILPATIIPTVRNLLLVKDLMVRYKLTKPAQPFFFGKQLDKLPAAAIAHLPRTKEGKLNVFPLGIAAGHASRFTMEELKDSLKACFEANRAVVSTSADPEVVLSQLIIRIAGA